jgi:threonine dehydratase
MTVTAANIRRAAEQLAGRIVRTPCRKSEALSARTGAEVYLKFENQQYTASFKGRGALVKLLSLDDPQRKRGVIAMSAGNHAQGVAFHAQKMGVPATIVMPVSTPFNKIQQTRQLGARVVLHGQQLAESEVKVHELIAAEDLVLVHPYDDEAIIAGQGTVALEMLEDHPDIDCLCVPVGGGGLLAGMAIAAHDLKPDLEIVGVQTRAFPSMHALLAGVPAECGATTIAEGIAVRNAGRITSAILREHAREILLVDEADIENAISLLISVEKTVAEGAGAAGLAALYADALRLSGVAVRSHDPDLVAAGLHHVGRSLGWV